MNSQDVEIENLNKLLMDAYDEQAKWDSFVDGRSYKEYKVDRQWGDLWKSKNNAWSQLDKAIRQAVPIKFVGNDGIERVMGTTAARTSDNMLYYSDKVDAKYCMLGYRLDRIKSFSTLNSSKIP